MAHRLAPEAVADLDGIAFHVATESGNVDIAARLILAITARFLALSEYPYLGRARDADLGLGRRSFPVGNYVIIYRVVEGDVLVLRVIHGRQDIASLFPP